MFAYEECQSDILLVANSAAVSALIPGGCEGFVNNVVPTLTAGANAVAEIGIINAASGNAIGDTGAAPITSPAEATAATQIFVGNHDGLAEINSAQGTGLTNTGVNFPINNDASGIAAKNIFVDNNAALVTLNNDKGLLATQTGTTTTISNAASAGTAAQDFINNNGAVVTLNGLKGTSSTQTGTTTTITNAATANTAAQDFINNNDIVVTLNDPATIGTGVDKIGVPTITTGNVGNAVTTFIANNNAGLELNVVNAQQGTASGKTGATVQIDNIAHANQATNDFIANNNLALAVNLLNNQNPSNVAGLQITDASVLTVPAYPTSIPALGTGQSDAQVKAAANPGDAFSTNSLQVLLVAHYAQLLCQDTTTKFNGNPTTDPVVNFCHVICGAGANFGSGWFDAGNPSCKTQ